MDHNLSIGAVSQLTGIPTETLRTWERRYNVVVPERNAAGRRMYSRAQVERLELIAHLAERGERVADLASLNDDGLRERMAMHGGHDVNEPRAVRVSVAHPLLGDELGGTLPAPGPQVVVVQAVRHPADLDAQADIVVTTHDLLGPQPAAALRALLARVGADGAVVLHGYTNRTQRAQLEAPNVRLLQVPQRTTEIRAAVGSLAGQVGAAQPVVPGPRFSQETLEHLLNGHPKLECECPNHIAALVIAVGGFETYSRSCASKSAADAALHADLAEETGWMRARLEQLLVRVCEHDGIAVPD